MQLRTPRFRLRPAIAVFAATLLSTASVGEAAAESASPFGDSSRVVDAQLDAMRGGFSASDGSVLRFGINLETSVNGHPIASLSISNDANGKITASEHNFGRTFVLKPDGSVQITQTMPGDTGSHHHHHSGTGMPSAGLPTTLTVPLNNGTQNRASGVIVTTTLVPTGGASISTNGLLASTGSLPNGNGVVTLIQNARSNVVIRTLNTLNVQVSGLGNSAVVRNSTAFRGFASSINFSVRH